ncbi:hypothetical protein Syun_002999 [Stephania yunnanensis]|uniref:Lon N-terminal domain-containing protein n=1 Tax=Stephania yunnanensis TaxID=152371 RepID=A0AAP0PZG0_9MAGN
MNASTVSAEFPLLPFDSSEVLVPSECKTLHLYEARFLALLEESLNRRKNHFVHFVLDPVLTSSSQAGVPFAARFGCLVLVEKVEKLKIGALVSIRGIGRVKITKFVQAEPYLKGLVVPLQDNSPDSVEDINSLVSKLREALSTLNSLQIKLKAPKDEPLQTQITNSLRWAERDPSTDSYAYFIPTLAERLSFVGLQPVSGATLSELLGLQRAKLQAMEIRDTLRRLEDSRQLIQQNISMVAAKLAIQSLEV